MRATKYDGDKRGRYISIPFHPFNFDHKGHAVEKADDTGVRRRYLEGISSGIQKDGQGERLTPNCIKSLNEQGNSGTVLLYSGLHGVNFTDDIGILKGSFVDRSGDWRTSFRLYDASDQMGTKTMEIVDKLWRQTNGLPPYNRPFQKGFSIEGVVPEEKILDKEINADGSYSKRVIDDMILDGVVVVKRPAYQASVVTAVYKCLDELPPQAIDKISKSMNTLLSDALRDKQNERNFYQRFMEINSALEEQISKIMSIDDRSVQRLEILMDEYKSIVVPLIIQNKDIFNPETIQENGDNNTSIIERDKRVDRIMKDLASQSRRLADVILKIRR